MSSLLSPLLVTSLLATASVAAADPLVGVSTDVGVPDGAMASVVVRPLSFLRAHAGAGYNAISTGFRAGATLSLPFWLSPTASISYGMYPEGDANPIARSRANSLLDVDRRVLCAGAGAEGQCKRRRLRVCR